MLRQQLQDLGMFSHVIANVIAKVKPAKCMTHCSQEILWMETMWTFTKDSPCGGAIIQHVNKIKQHVVLKRLTLALCLKFWFHLKASTGGCNDAALPVEGVAWVNLQRLTLVLNVLKRLVFKHGYHTNAFFPINSCALSKIPFSSYFIRDHKTVNKNSQ